MITAEQAFGIIIIFIILILLPGFCQVIGKRFGRGFMQGINQEIDDQLNQLIKKHKTPTSKETKNG